MKLQAQGWIRKRRPILRRLEEKTFQTKGGLVSDIHNNELYLIITNEDPEGAMGGPLESENDQSMP